MEILISLAVGLLVAGGVYLILRSRSFSVVLGFTLLSYAVNILVFVAGRLDRTVPPLAVPGAVRLADPLPQALVLTAIVIGFGMTAWLVALSLRALADHGTDAVDAGDGDADDGE